MRIQVNRHLPYWEASFLPKYYHDAKAPSYVI
jgi:hypothetical protein